MFLRLHSTFLCMLLACFAVTLAHAQELRVLGDYELKAHYKITGEKVTPVAIKPIKFRVFTDGIEVRVSPLNDESAASVFQIYRSDGVGRQNNGGLEVIPGVQALSKGDGGVRHLRASRESFTITHFPGKSDQTIVTYATAIPSTSPEGQTIPKAKPVEAP